jgi:hypothetical protein
VSNLTGNVTGNVSGNAATVTNGVYTNANSSLTGSGTRMVVADANGALSTQAVPASNGTTSISVNSTSSGDLDLYQDSQIRLWLDDQLSDDIELEVFNYPSSSAKVHVTYDIVNLNSTSTLDVSNPGTTTIDSSIDNDEIAKMYLWMPDATAWGYYEVTIIKSNGTNHTGTPIICKVVFHSI